MSCLNDGMLWAFTLEALDALKRLTQMDIDLDLAVALLETAWPEERIYRKDLYEPNEENQDL